MPQHRDLHILRDTGSEPATEDIQEPTDKQIHEAAQHRPTLLDPTRDRLMTPFRRAEEERLARCRPALAPLGDAALEIQEAQVGLASQRDDLGSHERRR
jgi:hypothetical protein